MQRMHVQTDLHNISTDQVHYIIYKQLLESIFLLLQYMKTYQTMHVYVVSFTTKVYLSSKITRRV